MSSAIEIFITFQNTKQALLQTLGEKSHAASQKIDQVFTGIESQLDRMARTGCIGQEAQRSDAAWVLSTNAAIAGIIQIDGAGREVMRLGRGDAGPVTDDGSAAQPILRADDKHPWFSPVSFGPNGPRMQIAAACTGPHAGTIVFNTDLNFLADILKGISGGTNGAKLLLTGEGRALAQTDFGVVSPDLISSILRQIQRSGQTPGRMFEASYTPNKAMLIGYAGVSRSGWMIFAAQPLSAAYAPVYGLLIRLSFYVIFGLLVSIAVSLWLARRMAPPLEAIGQGVARFANGNFAAETQVHSSDELQALAGDLNEAARRLQELFRQLEQKIASRTEELGQSVRELKALEEIGKALLASIDIDSLLNTILVRAMDLADVDASAIFNFELESGAFHLAQAHGFVPDLASQLRLRDDQSLNAPPKDDIFTQITTHKQLIQVPDIALAPDFPFREIILGGGFRSALIVPLIGPHAIAGALLLVSKHTGSFSANSAALMQTFAHQSALALHNGTLFAQIQENGRQLAIASEHKTRFFANMSHELRTPLNAVLGYTELLHDGLYGEMPETAKAVLERVQANGHHLLSLIDDVLDLSKLEAGELALVFDDYSLRETIEQAIQASASLAQTKKLWLTLETPDILPIGWGDERRLRQVFLNIIGNAIKFTDNGGVSISAKVSGENFEIIVTDTGAGIDPADQPRIFEAFQQGDNTSTRQKGGTGLGLSISKRFVEMHAGSIGVSSIKGDGATFSIILPVRGKPQNFIPGSA